MIRRPLQLSLLSAMIALSGCPKRTTVRVIGGKARPSRYVSPTAYEHYLRAELHAQRGAHREAVRELRSALVFDDEAPYLHARLAESLIALQQLQPAGAEIRRGLEIDGAHPDVLLAAAHLATTQRRVADAEDALRRCAKANGLDERCHLRLASLLGGQGRAAEARAMLSKLATRTGSPTPLVAHAEICLGALNLSCAAQKLTEALARQRSSRWLYRLARIQQAAGKWRAATKSWRAAFDRSGGSLQIARPLLTTLRLAKESTAVDDLLGILERQVKARGAGSASLAQLMLHAQRPARALAILTALTRRLPQEELARARALAKTGKRKEALAALNPLLEGPLAPEVALEAARLHERAGEGREALALLQRVHRRKGSAHGVAREYARLLIDGGQVEAGLKVARKMAAASKGDKRARLALAAALLRAGRWSTAIKEAERILEKAPGYAPALNFIGYALTVHRKRMDYAYRLLERANRHQPLEAYILDSMGFWQLRKGQARRAATLLEMAHHLEPFESEIAAHLGEAYFALGNKVAALALIRHGVVHANDARLATRLRARLSQLEGRSARNGGP